MVEKKFNKARQAAKRRNISFEISLEDFRRIYQNPICAITGKILYWDHHSEDLQASLDRVDNSVGYTKDNTVVISRRLNRIKSDASCKELLLLASYSQRSSRQCGS